MMYTLVNLIVMATVALGSVLIVAMLVAVATDNWLDK